MVNSAAGLLALLNEENVDIKVHALNKLLECVDLFWPEIAEALGTIEVLYEDSTFKHRQLAALLASKVYYHLQEYDESLVFALGADDLFKIDTKQNEYVDTIVAKAIDKYIEQRKANVVAKSNLKIDERIERVVQLMFTRCFDDGQFTQAIGIALESYRLDIVEKSFSLIPATKAQERSDLLNWVLDANLEIVQNMEFRNQVLRLLVTLYHSLEEPNYDSVCQGLIHLNDSTSCAQMLKDLVNKDKHHQLVAYQIAFDLEDNATQDFLNKVIDALPPVVNALTTTSPSNAMAVDVQQQSPLPLENSTDAAFAQIRAIISGEISIQLNLEFLHRNNKADILILKTSKAALESRNTVYHSAITFSNAFMNAGTTSDEFLRQNLEWLSRANNWTKFSATAALGVIHKGQISRGRDLLAPYLPQDGVSGSAFSEGGALFALGLINANHGAGVLDFLNQSLKDSMNETVQTGACLGLGVAGMATENDEVYESLKNTLFSDSAVAGESAGLAMGMIMLGSGSEKAIDEMIQYAHETQHEKIIRGIALGIAMIMYGREEKADELIEQLSADKDPVLRYGAIYTVAMAYAGTSNNKAIRKLLHVAVSDVNDDVRRAAVTAIGFVSFRNPDQVPKVVQLLSESYNPHVRYGASLALGISCAGTGNKEALELLDPMLKDTTDFVRQGALISAAMILVQHNEVMSPRVTAIRKMFETIIGDKHEEPMAKFGAVLGQGIIDAGGRNVTLSLASRNGHCSMPAIVGMALFTQFWYWYPLTHFLCLSFTPTGLIGLNANLEIPKFSFTSNAKPSLFAYHPQTKAPTTEVIEKIATVVLSTTAKAKARQQKVEKEKGGAVADMDVDESTNTPAVEKMKEDISIIAPKKEESFEVLENLARVTPLQYKHVSFDLNGARARYVPVKKGAVGGGILIMHDRTPDVPQELISVSTSGPPVPISSLAAGPSPTTATSTSAVEQEAAPPSPFEYVED